MNITELYNFISEIAEELPEPESTQLKELRDSLEEVGPRIWSEKIAIFASDMLAQDKGDFNKLLVLEAEAENASSKEIKLVYIFLFIVLIAFGIFFFY
jgi:magnesium-transporting ATPase (P-type)